MDFENELQKAKRERDLERQQTKVKRSSTKRKSGLAKQRNVIKPISQQQVWINQYSSAISAMLTKMAKTLWGEDSYSLIILDSNQSPSWYVVHQNGEAYSFQVTLIVSRRELDHELIQERIHRGYTMEEILKLPMAKSPDSARRAISFFERPTILEPTGFTVRGQETFSCGLSLQELKGALLKAFRSGPQKGKMEKEASALLAKLPYKKGEWEKGGWLIVAGILLTLALGLYFILAKDLVEGTAQVVWLAILAILVLLGLLVTRFGRRFARLSGWRKYIAWGSIIPGALAVLALVLSLSGYEA